MPAGDSLLSVALVASALLAVAVAVAVWRQRPKRGATWLAVTVFGFPPWALGEALLLSGSDPLSPATAAGLTQVGVAIIPVGWLLFTVGYTGSDDRLTPARTLALWIPAVAYVALSFANPSGMAFRLTDGAAGGHPEYAWGPAAWAFVALIGAYFWTGEGLMLRKVLRSRNVYRRRTAFLALVGLTVWLGHLTSVLGVTPLPNQTFTPVAFLVVGALSLLVIANHRYLRYVPVEPLLELVGSRFTDIAPIARDVVIEEMGSGVVVFDAEDRVVDLNPVARQMLDAEGERIVGRHVSDVVDVEAFVDGPPAFLDPEVTEGRFEGVWTDPDDGPRRCFDVVVTDLAEKRDDVAGQVAIVHDVTEERRRKQQLERQTDELRRQNEHLEEFASILSHDLRNPLTVSRGHVSLAREEGDLDLLETALDAHDRMETIIEDVLALAREGRTVDETAPLGLADLARDAWETVDTAGAALTVAVDPDRTVDADASRLRRAFENLFRNAVEHNATPARSAPSAESGEAAGEAERPDPMADVTADGATAEAPLSITVGELDDGFYVEDDGDGIPADERDRILDRGYSTSEDGSGFGLAIVQSIVEAHGWNLTVAESEAGGARFEVRGTGGVDEDLPLGE